MKLRYLVMGLLIAVMLTAGTVPVRAAERTAEDAKASARSVEDEIGAIRAQIALLQKKLEDLERKKTEVATPAKREVDPSLCADYDTAYRKAVKEDKPLVLFVGQ